MIQIKGGAKVRGTIEVDSDKSISHRAVMLGAISKNKSRVENILLSEDVLSTIQCFEKMGTTFCLKGTSLDITPSPLMAPLEALYTGNSGTTTRLLAGLLAGQHFTCTLFGDSSLNSRPMKRVIEPLKKMGANITAEKDNYCPMTIKPSKLKGITYKQTIASAQQKSAILLAGLNAEGYTTVIEKEKSRDHTEIMLKAMGADIAVEGNSITIKGGQSLIAKDLYVPNDISSASFFIALAVLSEDSEITINNVGLNPSRTGFLDVLKEMGADITIDYKNTEGEIYGNITAKSSRLKGCVIEGEIIPRLIDELPIISVCAAFSEGKTIIKDAEELKVKESNRIKAMVEELTKGNIKAEEMYDGMIITGGGAKSGSFCSYGDHRIAMSMIVFSLISNGISQVSDDKCIAISSPNFIEILLKLGLENNIEVRDKK